MAVYTGGGDKGKTSLFSGERVSKSHNRIEAYGDVDELCSVLGALVAMLPETSSEQIRQLQDIQAELLKASAWLATTPDSSMLEFLDEFTEESAKNLEHLIDKMEKELPKLNAFILPGGHLSASWAHVARTVCRRAERHVIRMMDDIAANEPASENTAAADKANEQIQLVLVFLNRLSDYLFVLARYCNKTTGITDIIWSK